jgi:hypothetical protein
MWASEAVRWMDMTTGRAPDRHSCLVLGDARLAEELKGRLGDLDIRLVRRPSELRDAVADGGTHLLLVSIPPATFSTSADGQPPVGAELRVIFPDSAGEPGAAAVEPDDDGSTRLGMGRRLMFDLRARDLIRDGETIHLRPNEFELLALFTAHPRRAFSRQELLAGVWHREAGRLRTLDVHVHWLRARSRPTRPHPGCSERWPGSATGTTHPDGEPSLTNC